VWKEACTFATGRRLQHGEEGGILTGLAAPSFRDHFDFFSIPESIAHDPLGKRARVKRSAHCPPNQLTATPGPRVSTSTCQRGCRCSEPLELNKGESVRSRDL
jgi:hypothetical protein